MTTAAEFEDIRVRSVKIRGEESGICMLRAGHTAPECWCYLAGYNGSTLNCPPKFEPEPEAPEPPPLHMNDMPVPWHPSRKP